MTGANDNSGFAFTVTAPIHAEYLRMKREFENARATAEQHADLDRLFAEQSRLAVGIACTRVTASLKSLYDELTIGGAA